MPFNNEINPGSRAVDTQQTFYAMSPFAPTGLPKAVTPILDCTQAQSFNLALTPIVTTLANQQSIEFILVWYAADQKTIVRYKPYEINAGQTTDTTNVTTYITDIALGAYVQIWCTGIGFNTGQSAVSSISGTFNTSSRVVNKARVAEIGSESPPVADTINSSADGLLQHTGNIALGAGASTGLIGCCLAFDPIMIAINGASATCRLRGGFGAAAAAPIAGPNNVGFTLVPAAFGAANNQAAIYGPWPAMSRPLFFVLTNIGSGAGQVSVDAWTSGN